MSEEKRMLGNYEVTQSIYVGDKEVVLAVDKKEQYPFLVCYCDYHNPLSAAWATEGVASDDYLEAMEIFTERVQSQIDRTRAELAEGGNGATGGRGQAVFGTCLATGERARWERYDVLGEIKPECMPDWAKEALAKVKGQEKAPKHKDLER